jgi:hypothetical protein
MYYSMRIRAVGKCPAGECVYTNVFAGITEEAV